MGPLIVVAAIEVAHAVLLEAALSFLGLGVQPPLFSWGLMVAEAKAQLLFRPWMIAVPGAGLVLLIFAINLVGDAIRDVTAPEGRSEEHTSELPSLMRISYAVFCLKKKK